MNYTDEQLKRALAKMLPELVAVCNSQLCWIADDVEIIDTAILHLCWLVEETLDDEQQLNYVRCLDEDVIRQFWGQVWYTLVADSRLMATTHHRTSQGERS